MHKKITNVPTLFFLRPLQETNNIFFLALWCLAHKLAFEGFLLYSQICYCSIDTYQIKVGMELNQKQEEICNHDKNCQSLTIGEKSIAA